ncbi:hypothetical protein BamIOP4010DRAFT_6043 [Burkholderia ambifaria IOP40-10]|uniref:Uncharacterized protein n=1 Tax=Burkholderia ambifaria IOP40-10 TaxID=396596 RepID=B1FPS9_9BURK|nr:hypothetical protein BamIOP4010DRAFT_6043 [Burkholderia ambifaria IOP40-10]
MMAVKPPPYLLITITSTEPISIAVGTTVNTATPSR